MKDKEARDRIRELGEVVEANDKRFWGAYRDLKESITDVTEVSCPVCGHVTLMRAIVPKPRTPVMYKEDMMALMEDKKTHLYCYGCGKTFREQNGLVELGSSCPQ